MSGRERSVCLQMTGVLPGFWIWIFVVGACVCASAVSAEEAEEAVGEFNSRIQPLLEHYCYDCHGEGSAKGDVSLDDPAKGAQHLDNRELWLQVWKNLRPRMSVRS